ncbi:MULTISPECIES: cytochrome bd-I oxidase subunit CydX [unclassified Acinetobacter]|uniref:cytochrome bd-I oxidase subunit CydX n=1 Tax=unclassified Acinetobacter TaxID=196816 RepID=UPI0035BAE6C1
MWYFAWVLGLGFAVLLAVLNAMWLENEEARLKSYGEKPIVDDGTLSEGNPAILIDKKGESGDNQIL